MESNYIPCIDCDTLFLSTHPNMIRCPVCREAHSIACRKATQRRYGQRVKLAKHGTKSKKRAATLQDNIEAADRAGISYGQYMARLIIERGKSK